MIVDQSAQRFPERIGGHGHHVHVLGIRVFRQELFNPLRRADGIIGAAQEHKPLESYGALKGFSKNDENSFYDAEVAPVDRNPMLGKEEVGL